jgi:hypothetical protein
MIIVVIKPCWCPEKERHLRGGWDHCQQQHEGVLRITDCHLMKKHMRSLATTETAKAFQSKCKSHKPPGRWVITSVPISRGSGRHFPSWRLRETCPSSSRNSSSMVDEGGCPGDWTWLQFKRWRPRDPQHSTITCTTLLPRSMEAPTLRYSRTTYMRVSTANFTDVQRFNSLEGVMFQTSRKPLKSCCTPEMWQTFAWAIESAKSEVSDCNNSRGRLQQFLGVKHSWESLVILVERV